MSAAAVSLGTFAFPTTEAGNGPASPDFVELDGVLYATNRDGQLARYNGTAWQQVVTTRVFNTNPIDNDSAPSLVSHNHEIFIGGWNFNLPLSRNNIYKWDGAVGWLDAGFDTQFPAYGNIHPWPTAFASVGGRLFLALAEGPGGWYYVHEYVAGVWSVVGKAAIPPLESGDFGWPYSSFVAHAGHYYVVFSDGRMFEINGEAIMPTIIGFTHMPDLNEGRFPLDRLTNAVSYNGYIYHIKSRAASFAPGGDAVLYRWNSGSSWEVVLPYSAARPCYASLLPFGGKLYLGMDNLSRTFDVLEEADATINVVLNPGRAYKMVTIGMRLFTSAGGNFYEITGLVTPPTASNILLDSTGEISHARILKAHRNPQQAEKFHVMMQEAH